MASYRTVRCRIFPALSLATLLLLLGATTVPAIELEKPIDCQPGLDCFVQNYVDLAPGTEYKDKTCGPLTYDKH